MENTNLRTAFCSGTVEYCSSGDLVHLVVLCICYFMLLSKPLLTKQDTFFERGRFDESMFYELNFMWNWRGHWEVGLENKINFIIKLTLQ